MSALIFTMIDTMAQMLAAGALSVAAMPGQAFPAPSVKKPRHGPHALNPHTLSDIGVEPGALTWRP